MKTILHILLFTILVIVISCRKIELFKPYPIAEKITINGTVSDVNNNLLDSVYVRLYESSFMTIAIPINNMYSKDGIFKFEFTPEEKYTYHLNFEKKGYRIDTYHSVDKKKEFQEFNVIMEREEER